MKKQIFKYLVYATLMLLGNAASAAPDTVTLKLGNPSRSNDIHIGDVLHRRVELTVDQPYQVSRNAFPIKGSNINGVELSEIQVDVAQKGEKNIYRIDLSYQVFRHANAPVVMELPAEKFVFTGGPRALSIGIPVWHFWFSPLVASDISHALANLQPQQPPPLVNIMNHQYLLTLFIFLLAAGLIGLVYINADKRWLPFMGGAFAQAHRQLKRLSKTPGEERKALLYLHQAFNRVNGANLFAWDIDAFITTHPGFSASRPDIEAFFDSSNKSLFAQQQHDSGTFIQSLIVLSRRLRDCERGI